MLVAMERMWVRRCLITAAVLGALVLFVVVMWRVPWWLDDHYLTDALTPAQATTVAGLRTALVALGAGLLVVAGLYYTHSTLQVTREGHVTDRYTKAVEQLGAPVLEVRVGGIYALERIMRDSVKDQSTVVEVLAAFLRERGRSQSLAATPDPQLMSAGSRRVERARRRVSRREQALIKPTADVQAALTVLVRRPRHGELFRLDLSGAHLEGANLINANLMFTNLSGAHLEGADLTEAQLGGANLSGAHLEGADLTLVDLSDAENVTMEQFESTAKPWLVMPPSFGLQDGLVD
ncbi:pentapeptide repeat-containing protein [Streptomyces goshikiensis]|uniref:pentapeptide repeat-containing protein n=1 Tax=Streptomyces goshikiensis TaxID=1942 RepID=UPI0037B2663D